MLQEQRTRTNVHLSNEFELATLVCVLPMRVVTRGTQYSRVHPEKHMVGHSAARDIPLLLWNSRIDYRFYENPRLAPYPESDESPTRPFPEVKNIGYCIMRNWACTQVTHYCGKVKGKVVPVLN
jgi:hypothetical protein